MTWAGPLKAALGWRWVLAMPSGCGLYAASHQSPHPAAGPCLGLNAKSTTSKLCVFGQITDPLCATVSSSLK